MLYVVYAPSGEMFEVRASRLQELIVEKGWTFWPPEKDVDVFGDNTGQPEPGATDSNGVSCDGRQANPQSRIEDS